MAARALSIFFSRTFRSSGGYTGRPMLLSAGTATTGSDFAFNSVCRRNGSSSSGNGSNSNNNHSTSHERPTGAKVGNPMGFFNPLHPLNSLWMTIELEEMQSIAWAQTAVGSQALEFINQEAKDIILPSSLEDYLQKRQIFPGKSRTLSVLVVGAQAESYLPLIWWREALVTCEKTTSLSLKFVGPGLLLGNEKTASLASNTGHCDTGREVRKYVEKHLKTQLHLNEDAISLLQEADVFVLFNPGYGYANKTYLKESWSPTMKLLLGTKKPIICTSQSPIDLRRDLDELTALSVKENHSNECDPIDMLVHPHENPFYNRMRNFDMLEDSGAEEVTGNQFIYAFRMK